MHSHVSPPLYSSACLVATGALANDFPEGARMRQGGVGKEVQAWPNVSSEGVGGMTAPSIQGVRCGLL
jgi:hypothetical protein